METFLILNGYELGATADEQERIMLDLAAGNLSRNIFEEWVQQHAIQTAQ